LLHFGSRIEEDQRVDPDLFRFGARTREGRAATAACNAMAGGAVRVMLRFDRFGSGHDQPKGAGNGAEQRYPWR
jgi:hypothetical protein